MQTDLFVESDRVIPPGFRYTDRTIFMRRSAVNRGASCRFAFSR